MPDTRDMSDTRHAGTPAAPTSPPQPDRDGHFGPFGGRFMPEALMVALDDLDRAYRQIADDEGFQSEFARLLSDYAGRPSLLTEAERFSEHAGARVLLKREDLNHTGSHKINNVL